MSRKKDDDSLPIIGQAVILSGNPDVGYLGKKVPLTTEDGRTLCCMAQRGECRHNTRHYGGGWRSEDFWSLPQVEPGCDRRCGYRVEVADPETDTEYTTRLPAYDPYGFEFYKQPSDACTYYHAEGEDYRHDASTCPQCSQPKVAPQDEWVDMYQVGQYTDRHLGMMEMFLDGKDYDPIDELPATSGTKAAIRKVVDQRKASKKKP